MTKSVFKTEYSLYRKSIKITRSDSIESFRDAINRNVFLKQIYLNRDFVLPTSLKIWAYKNRSNLGGNTQAKNRTSKA